MEEYLLRFVTWFNWFVLGYYTATNLVYLLILGTASLVIVSHQLRLGYGRYQESMHDLVTPPISVLISAFNEEANIVESVRSLSLLNYPDFEVIVTNDGSTDGTLDRLVRAFDLRRVNFVYRDILPTAQVRGFYANPDHPKLLVIDKEHSGKADSLNAAMNCSRAPYFCSVDADSVLERDALMRLMRPIIEEPGVVIATGGIVRIANGCVIRGGRLVKVQLPPDPVSRFQVVEYTRGFLFGRSGLSALNSLLIISGTFSMFDKKMVQAAGGYSLNTVTEDMELVVRLHKMLHESGRRYRINFVPDPICWTEAPRTLKMLRRQRRRWHTGLAESLVHYRAMLFNPRYGRIGLFAMPYHLLIELLGPVVEIAGYAAVTISWLFGIINYDFFLLFLTMAILVGIFHSTSAIFLEEITYRRYPRFKELMLLLLYGVLENFGYRQLNSLWRAEAVVKYLFTRKKKWEYVKKTGFEAAT